MGEAVSVQGRQKDTKEYVEQATRKYSDYKDIRSQMKMGAAGMREVEREVSKSETYIVELDAQEVKYTSAISREKEKFDRLKAQTVDLDQDELADARLSLRPQMEHEIQDRIRKSAQRISLAKYQASVSDADKMLGEGDMAERHEERKQLRRMEKCQRPKRESRTRQQER